MARFYGSMRGNRGEATRMGTPNSGISGHIRGWNVGGEVGMIARGEQDTCVLTLTGGSSGKRNLGVEIVAFEEEGPRVRYLVRLPGGIELRGYVGDAEVSAYDVSGGYDPANPDGELIYTFNKGDEHRWATQPARVRLDDAIRRNYFES